ncbi:DUF4064 domain-containing protein [Melissococcus plutonius]|uniref:Uncharacterized protein n=1 Tax=Melissococcus plutonius TaxID=33970 RepID=A0A2Z5Y424_9ENTE|nr:DUF4064 domain-containing protein [Melissococcus plutonius]BAL62635.1 hypothetical protein MPD5_1431 [Melissococcus plutonius DAT561]MCV2498560.1 DUF4064 domain-containing protein [Melissococcus plutonius]MCV2501747.1 DUF4064 domain-containing protein [Melissococcus plutonius]MCV2504772.1 DUF4064 domain-containing protein [Melissococcus plutonius]MCV2507232.1 DUF4064 domain-containing protein [Melissococcus plutonius]
MKRRLECWLGFIGVGLTLLFLGGIALSVQQLTIAEYEKTFKPVFASSLGHLDSEKGVELFRTLGAWFGFTILFVLIFVTLATLFIMKNSAPVKAGIFYMLAGLTTLIGSQLIAFFIAFLFFIAALCCFFRGEKLNERSSHQKSNLKRI